MRESVCGSMRIWLKYIGRGLVLLIFRQLAPPSSRAIDAALGLVLDARVERRWDSLR